MDITRKHLTSIAWAAIRWALVRGLLFFVVMMGLSLSFIFLNADLSPTVPWFPLPVTLVIAGAPLGHRRWGIPLRPPKNGPWAQV